MRLFLNIILQGGALNGKLYQCLTIKLKINEK